MTLKLSDPEEVAMTTKIHNARSRMVRWFRRLAEQRKTRGRWYDVDHCGM